jgi:hypothetical protein
MISLNGLALVLAAAMLPVACWDSIPAVRTRFGIIVIAVAWVALVTIGGIAVVVAGSGVNTSVVVHSGRRCGIRCGPRLPDRSRPKR